MDLVDATRYSLADFHLSDSDDPLVPPSDYAAWRSATVWATSLYDTIVRTLKGAA